ncbi:hypothetical protein [Nonomuraea fuscirosea]
MVRVPRHKSPELPSGPLGLRPFTADAVRIVALATSGANDHTRVIEVEVR